MERRFVTALLMLTTISAGLLAGFFYTWSFTIMQSLNLTDESIASSAMNSINANIRSGWFAAIFFGAPALILISLIVTMRKNRKPPLWILSAFVFAVCTLAITFTQHIPLNDELANGLAWNQYYPEWVTWNHARMCTSLLAFLSMLLGLVSHIKVYENRSSSLGT